MTDVPLQPFSPPTALFDKLNLSTTISPGIALEVLLFAVFGFWALYTLIAIYHWLKYSHASLIAFPAIAAHLFVSFALMTYALTGAIPQI
jgi:hypothetical protein